MLTVVPDAQLKEKIVKEKNFEKCWQGANFEIDTFSKKKNLEKCWQGAKFGIATFSKKKTLKNVDRVLPVRLPHSLKKTWKNVDRVLTLRLPHSLKNIARIANAVQVTLWL